MVLGEINIRDIMVKTHKEMFTIKIHTKLVTGIVVLVVAALTAITVYDMSYGSPVAIIQNPEDIQVVSIQYGDTDVTESVDKQELIQLISKYSCRRVPNKFYHESLANRTVGIDLAIRDKSLHLFFGSVNICYEGGGHGWKEIIDAGMFLDELIALF